MNNPTFDDTLETEIRMVSALVFLSLIAILTDSATWSIFWLVLGWAMGSAIRVYGVHRKTKVPS